MAFSVPGDIRPFTQKGLKIRWTQPTLGINYGNISQEPTFAAGASTITVIPNDDYGVANEAITDFWISYGNPPDFPASFHYSPTVSGFGVGQLPTNTVNEFVISDKWCSVSVRQATQGTSNNVAFTVTTPIVSQTRTNAVWGVTWWQAFDNGAELSPPGRAFIGSASSTITLHSTTASGAWTNVNGKAVSFTNLAYPI